jgi:hypothetical protein
MVVPPSHYPIRDAAAGLGRDINHRPGDHREGEPWPPDRDMQRQIERKECLARSCLADNEADLFAIEQRPSSGARMSANFTSCK